MIVFFRRILLVGFLAGRLSSSSSPSPPMISRRRRSSTLCEALGASGPQGEPSV